MSPFQYGIAPGERNEYSFCFCPLPGARSSRLCNVPRVKAKAGRAVRLALLLALWIEEIEGKK